MSILEIQDRCLTSGRIIQVSDLSRQNLEGIEEIRRAMDEIGISIRAIIGLGLKNVGAMDALGGEVRRFTV